MGRLSAANSLLTIMTERCTYYLNSRFPWLIYSMNIIRYKVSCYEDFIIYMLDIKILAYYLVVKNTNTEVLA